MKSEVYITRSKGLYVILGIFLFYGAVLVSVACLTGEGAVDGIKLFVYSLIAVPFLIGAIYSWYWAFSKKPVIIINSAGISYKNELLLWSRIETYNTLRDCRDEACIDFLIIKYENHGRLEIQYSDLNTDFKHIRKCIKQFSVNDKITDEGHVELKGNS